MTSALMPTYARQPVAFSHGEGVWLYDTEGRRYLDTTAGIAVCGLGHAHPVVAEAIADQARTLVHTSNLFQVPLQETLAAELTKVSGMDLAFFSNSGAEANEAAIKLARRYAHAKYGPDRFEIITMKNSFHGRTLATITATGQDKVQKGFEPLMPGFAYAPFNDFAAIEAMAGERTAAIMLEPIQGEGGVHVADREYLQRLREFCTQRDILLIFDEVQTGMGRTGTLFAYQQLGVEPDIMTLAKGLGGGMPIGACLAKEPVAAVFQPGAHASTFGGNPLACAAALAVCRALLEGSVLDNAKRMGEYLVQGLAKCKDRHRNVREVRGLGLLQGMELDIDAKTVVADCLVRGVLVNAASEQVLRFVPPLVITQREIDKLLETLTVIFTRRATEEKAAHH